MILKEEIIDHLSILIANNVIGDKQYNNRFKGFVGELDFKEFIRLNKPKNTYLDGGIFLPTKEKASYLDKPVFFTVTSDPIDQYNVIYRQIAHVDCKALYILSWQSDTEKAWESRDLLMIGKKLLVPALTVNKYIHGNFMPSSLEEFLGEFRRIHYYRYEDKVHAEIKEKFVDILMRFDEKHLKDLYVQRLVFDGFIGLKYERGKPSDIDQVVRSRQNGEYYFLEVKEKDLCKREPKGFGMDVDRVIFFDELSNQTSIQTFYFIKQVKEQQKREFLNWRYIPMADFSAYCDRTSVEGGTGMRSENSSNPTWICPEKYFKTYR